MNEKNNKIEYKMRIIIFGVKFAYLKLHSFEILYMKYFSFLQYMPCFMFYTLRYDVIVIHIHTFSNKLCALYKSFIMLDSLMLIVRIALRAFIESFS